MRGYVCAAALGLAAWTATTAAAAEVGRARLVVRFEPASARPGDAVQVEVTSLDASGSPVDLPAPLAVDADAGKVRAPERRKVGVYVAILTVPRQLPLSRSILVLARAGGISREASLQVVSGPAAVMKLEGPPDCTVDEDVCRLEVSAVDAAGNAADEVPTGKAELGRVLPPSAAGGGRWVMLYRPPQVERDADDVVTIELGALRAEHHIHLVAARMHFDLAPRVGGVYQDSRSGLSAGAQALGERLLSSGWLLGVGLEGSWWSVTRSGAGSSHIDRNQLAAGALLLAERRVSRRLVATVSAGGGLVHVTATDRIPSQPNVSDSKWAPTAFAAAGLGYDASFGMPFLELRGAWVGDPKLATDTGSRSPLFLLLGYRFHVR